jgi:hypothetical protein
MVESKNLAALAALAVFSDILQQFCADGGKAEQPSEPSKSPSMPSYLWTSS